MNYCKNCNKEITKYSKSGLCISCVRIGKKLSEETLLKLSGPNHWNFGNGNHGSIFNCKKCGKNITKWSKTSMCKSCSHVGRIVKPEFRMEMSVRMIGNKRGLYKRTNEMNAKRSRILEGNKNGKGNKGKNHTPEAICKMRLLAIDRISKNKFNGRQIIPGWNEMACQKIDEYGKQNGYNFQHAMNGGEHYIKELGYWVDGYDKEKNAVIEYYEKHHEKQVQKDLCRETEICNHLGCDFIVLFEK